MTQSHIRNFAIIAHIDHGKSTLADRLMEMTGTVTTREMQEQLLDSNPIERERGITIKLAPVRMMYKARISNIEIRNKSKNSNTNNQNNFGFRASDFGFSNSGYILNLIDTPGHVDFTYEVSRSLAACEGALLVVDASQGVQAQTLANLHLARNHHLKIIPLINKIDLPNARIQETKKELNELGFADDEIMEISAKTGKGVEEVLDVIVDRIPSPKGNPEHQTRALIFSSQYDPHKGVVVFVRIVDGNIGVSDHAPVVNEHVDVRMTGPVAGFLPSDVLATETDTQISEESRPHDNRNRVLSKNGTQSASLRALEGSPSTRATRFSSQQTRIRFLQSGAEVTPIEIGYFSPKMIASGGLSCGEVGYIATGLKDVRMAKVGDTITISNINNQKSKIQTNNQFDVTSVLSNDRTIQPLPGYKEPKPMVFVGLFPIEQEEFTQSRVAMEKLRLSDSAFSFRPIASQALGNGFHCGFLGLLHAEIVQERLSREFGLSLLATAPSVEYRIELKKGVNPSKAGLVHGSQLLEQKTQKTQIVRNSEHQTVGESESPILRNSDFSEHSESSVFSITSPSEFPDPTYLERVSEPIMQVTIYTPKRYIGAIMQLCEKKRGTYVDLIYHNEQTEFTYLIPLSDMIVDFFDGLKSVTEGYASLDYTFFDYQQADVIKVDILVNHEQVDALSFLIVKDHARVRGKEIVDRLADVLPRQQFNIPVQAAIGGEIIARADIKPFRKDVIAKLYGGDRTRKDKLLKKQKKGKTRMKLIGRVEIPQDAFFDVLKR